MNLSSNVVKMKILDIPAFCHPKEELLFKLKDTKSLIRIHSLNSEMLIIARKNRTLTDILINNEFNIIDGHWVAKFLKLKYRRTVEKISGSDFIYELCKYAKSVNGRIFLLGASEEVLQKAILRLKYMYKDVTISGYSPPFFKNFPETENRKMLDKIEEFMPQFLVVCFGQPKQDIWIKANEDVLTKMGVKAALSAGGTLDFVSGKVKRAPQWIQNIGMEWLYRLSKEPRARFRRQIKTVPSFFILGLLDIFKYRTLSFSNTSIQHQL